MTNTAHSKAIAEAYKRLWRVYWIDVKILNKYGEVESHERFAAGSYSAAAKKTHLWLSGADIKNPSKVIKTSENTWTWEAQS